MEQKIKDRIAQLEREREQLIEEANQRIASYNGAIAELRGLLRQEDEAQEETELVEE